MLCVTKTYELGFALCHRLAMILDQAMTVAMILDQNISKFPDSFS